MYVRVYVFHILVRPSFSALLSVLDAIAFLRGPCRIHGVGRNGPDESVPEFEEASRPARWQSLELQLRMKAHAAPCSGMFDILPSLSLVLDAPRRNLCDGLSGVVILDPSTLMSVMYRHSTGLWASGKRFS